MNKDLIQSIKVIVLGLVIGVGASLAYATWQEPPVGTIPPNNNVYGPINTGLSEQYKEGNLFIGKNLRVGEGPDGGGIRSTGPALLNDIVVIGLDPGASGSAAIHKDSNLAEKKPNGLFAGLSKFLKLNEVSLGTKKAIAWQNPTCSPACSTSEVCVLPLNGSTNGICMPSFQWDVSPTTLPSSGNNYSVDIGWSLPETFTCNGSSNPATSWNGYHILPGAGSAGSPLHITSLNQSTSFLISCTDIETGESGQKQVDVVVNGVAAPGDLTGGVSSGYDGYQLVVFGDSYFQGTAKINNKGVCLQDGTNCQAQRQFGGTYDRVFEVTPTNCRNVNPLTGSCTCPSGFTSYKMSDYKGANSMSYEMFGCYK